MTKPKMERWRRGARIEFHCPSCGNRLAAIVRPKHRKPSGETQAHIRWRGIAMAAALKRFTYGDRQRAVMGRQMYTRFSEEDAARVHQLAAKLNCSLAEAIRTLCTWGFETLEGGEDE